MFLEMQASSSSEADLSGIRGGRLTDSIRSYDANASAYAQRYERVDLTAIRGAFLDELGKRSGLVLDVGCGAGRDTSAFLKSSRRVVGVDLSYGMLDQARLKHPGLVLVRADFRQLPLTGGICGGVWSLASLVHLDYDGVETALREFMRVLMPGGVFFVSVPSGASSEWRADQSGGRRWFQYHRPDEFATLVEAAGFRVVSLEDVPGVAAGRWINLLAGRP
jgi:SAM-dependent methyltransferase